MYKLVLLTHNNKLLELHKNLFVFNFAILGHLPWTSTIRNCALSTTNQKCTVLVRHLTEAGNTLLTSNTEAMSQSSAKWADEILKPQKITKTKLSCGFLSITCCSPWVPFHSYTLFYAIGTHLCFLYMDSVS